MKVVYVHISTTVKNVIIKTSWLNADVLHRIKFQVIFCSTTSKLRHFIYTILRYVGCDIYYKNQSTS